jgi:hypothetical protein
MTTVPTVTGPVELDELGPTLMHEHVFIMQPEMRENYGTVLGDAPYWDEEERVAPSSSSRASWPTAPTPSSRSCSYASCARASTTPGSAPRS